MGSCCSSRNDITVTSSPPNKRCHVIWIDRNVNNEENKKYVKNLEIRSITVDTFVDIYSGLNKILLNKDIYFEDIYIILSGSLYQDFISQFKQYLMDIFVVPKIVIFTSNKKSFLEKNSNIIKNKFYNLGGIQTLFKDVYEDFLTKKLWKKSYKINNKALNNNNGGEQYTFEYINNKLELYLPVFYKALIKLNKNDIFDELTHYLYDTYKKNECVKKLLEPIDGIPEIPIEILCKYYARLYTIESDYYDDLNKSLREENLQLKNEELLFSATKDNYYSITFIKSFYEGIKLGCFKIELKDKLYRFSCIGQKELDKIKEYLKNKKSGIPGSIFFSKTFLSFSEEKEVANEFYKKYEKNKSNYEKKNLVPVFFHLIKKEDIKESLYSHIKMDNISVFENEKEVLFLPFTCFEILEVIPVEKKAIEKEKVKSISNKKNNVEYYIIKLTYLGQYEKELKNIEKEEKIPNTEFKAKLEESKLIEFNQDITNKRVIDEFNEYEKNFRKNNKDIYIIIDVKEEDIDENHYVSIFGKNLEENGTDFVKENKDKIKILINGEEKILEYKYKLRKGYNEIIIKLNTHEIDNLSYMFSGCTSLKNIKGLKYLDTKNIKNFSKIFYGCKSLSDIKGLQNWNVSNGNNFSGIFAQCNLLKDIKALENWNVSNGNNFLGMFYNCKLLSDIKALKNWNVSNGKNFEATFRECESLSGITELQNWDISKGNNFLNMFFGCSSLSDIKGLQNWNVSNGNNFEGMFAQCNLLKDIKALENWNVSNGNNFLGMFAQCNLLSDIKALKNWNVSNGNNFSVMFWDCKSLSDITELQNWNVSNGNNFSNMFFGCKSLLDIKGLQNWNVSNGNNFEGMFFGCESLFDIKGLQNWNVSNGNNFSYMFGYCISLLNVNALQNWNVSNGINFSYMFMGCKSLLDIKGLQNWNVSNGNNISGMFIECNSLKEIKPLENWNVSNANNFAGMFWKCESLSDIKGLQNWNVSNGINFSGIFRECKSLSDLKPLEKWDVSNGNNFSQIFLGCESLLNINGLQNWNVSNGKDFSYIFCECISLSDIYPLQYWNVSNGNNFEGVFNQCRSLYDKRPIQNWNVPNINNNFTMPSSYNLLSGFMPIRLNVYNWNNQGYNRFFYV